jgi:hypothetical protein
MDRRRLTIAGTSVAHDMSRLAPQQTGDTARESDGSREPSRRGGAARQAPAAEPRIERISKRAHELYVARGGTHGRALEDWLQAEREIDAES